MSSKRDTVNISRKFFVYSINLLFVFIAISGCLPESTPQAPKPQPPTQTPAPETIFPLHWPVPPPTKDQISEVKNCNLESLAHERYHGTIADLSTAFTPTSACDWAVLAFAYPPVGQNVSDSAQVALAQAVSRNPGFALATPLFYRFFDRLSLVEPPTFTQHEEITDVQIKYQWGGLGDSVYYTVEIHNSNSNPIITARPDKISASMKTDVNKKLIQALAQALSDLVPVRTFFSLSPCFDNYPSWEVTLAFTDHTGIRIESYGNYLDFGGPWFTYIDGQEYIQVSAAFPNALGRLVSSLDLPPGEPGATTCGGNDEDVFGQAFPNWAMANYGQTLIPPTEISTPVLTPTSLFKMTHEPPSKTITGIFALKKVDWYGTGYQLLRFFDDGLVIYDNIGIDSDRKTDWPDFAYSSMYRESNSGCRGNYYFNKTRIEFSIACVSPTAWWDETPVPWNIDYVGTYDGQKLILDSYSHFNGFADTKQIFRPIEDPSLKP